MVMNKSVPPQNTEKLQKVLANAGLGSRRQIEEWISDGRIEVDNQIAVIGQRVSADAKITVDGQPLKSHQLTGKEKTRVLIYHKPEGEICTRSDPEGRPTVFNRLPMLRRGRWIAIGRLDLNTTGLLLFTNNGELANQLMHPKNTYEREYAVRVLGNVDQPMIKRLLRGVQLEDGLAKFNTIVDAGGQGANHWYHVTLNEGRNREVRRLWESQDVKVSRLMRVRFGTIQLPRGLKPGRWEELTEDQIESLINKKEVKLDTKRTIKKSPSTRPKDLVKPKKTIRTMHDRRVLVLPKRRKEK